MTTPDQVLELLAKYGPGAVFAVMWWLERTERVKISGKFENVSERCIVVMTELKGLLAGRGSA